jgi:hypothetical protein
MTVLTGFIIVSFSCSICLTINEEIQFVKDQVSESYSRSVFGFLDLTGNMGGVFGILQTAGSFIVSIFAGKIFLYSMLSRLYQVDNCLIEETEHDEKEKLGGHKTIKVLPLDSYQVDGKHPISSENIFGFNPTSSVHKSVFSALTFRINSLEEKSQVLPSKRKIK